MMLFSTGNTSQITLKATIGLDEADSSYGWKEGDSIGVKFSARFEV